MTVQETEKEHGKQKLAALIAYNGMNDSFNYAEGEAANAVRQQALNHYQVHGPDREQNFLFGPDNQTELQGDVALSAQVQPGAQLYLRPRTAGGGV
jgi:hypothetical protein